MGLANIEIASPLTTRKSLRRFSRPGRPPPYSKGPNPVGSADLWKKQKRFLESGSHNNPYVNPNRVYIRVVSRSSRFPVGASQPSYVHGTVPQRPPRRRGTAQDVHR